MIYFVFIPAIDKDVLFEGNENGEEEKKIIINALKTKGTIVSLNNADVLIPVYYDDHNPDCSDLKRIVHGFDISHQDVTMIFKITPPDVIDDWQFEGYYATLDRAMYFMEGYFSLSPIRIDLGSLDHDLLKIRNSEERRETRRFRERK